MNSVLKDHVAALASYCTYAMAWNARDVNLTQPLDRWALSVKLNIRIWGEPGSAIPGSRLERGYCEACGQPIRVYPGVADESDATRGVRLLGQSCTTCRANEHPGYNQCGASFKDDPSFDNVVRLIEDGYRG